MKKILKFFTTTLPHIFQRKNHQNRKALKYLKRLGFPMPRIRRALLYLNDLNIVILADRKISNPTIYMTIDGRKKNLTSQLLIARNLDLNREELFPPIESPSTGSGPNGTKDLNP